MLFGVAPSYDQLRVFGSLCYIHHWPRDKDKFSSRSRKCISVGYPFGKKGWRVYDIDRSKFFISRDIVFQENDFPFASSYTTPTVSPITVASPDDDWLVLPTELDSTPPVFNDRGSNVETVPDIVAV